MHVSGPHTNLSLVYDGQGDRLRSYEQGSRRRRCATRHRTSPAGSAPGRARAGGLRLPEPRHRRGPAVRYTFATTRSHLPGHRPAGQRAAGHRPSRRDHRRGRLRCLGHRPPQQPAAWRDAAGRAAGRARPSASPGSSTTPGRAPMRCGPGTTTRARGASRARTRWPNPQVPVTINPYEYAGNMPTDVTDPSGQGWASRAQSMPMMPTVTDLQQSAIGGPLTRDVQLAVPRDRLGHRAEAPRLLGTGVQEAGLWAGAGSAVRPGGGTSSAAAARAPATLGYGPISSIRQPVPTGTSSTSRQRQAKNRLFGAPRSNHHRVRGSTGGLVAVGKSCLRT